MKKAKYRRKKEIYMCMLKMSKADVHNLKFIYINRTEKLEIRLRKMMFRRFAHIFLNVCIKISIVLLNLLLQFPRRYLKLQKLQGL